MENNLCVCTCLQVCSHGASEQFASGSDGLRVSSSQGTFACISCHLISELLSRCSRFLIPWEIVVVVISEWDMNQLCFVLCFALQFPLLSRSGRLNRLVFESRDTNNDHIKLDAIPGGPEAFELAVKFCYGIPVELTPQNVATLRCAAEYLEMTDSLEDGNLVSKTEHYLSFVVLASWKDSITVLQSCNRLLPWAEELQIVRRCSESVAWKACTDPHGIRWSFSSNSSAPPVLWDGLKQAQVGKHIPHDWWVEDVIQLNFDAFSRVMTAIKVKGMAYTLVGSAIAQYATKWLPGLEKKSRIKQQHGDVNKSEALPQGITGKEIVVRETQDAPSHNQIENRALVEGIVGMLPPQLDAVSCSFLLRLLRVACLSGAGPPCKGELERRVGMQMEHASLSDLLIPSSQSSSDSLYDIDVVQRILEQFLLKVSPFNLLNEIFFFTNLILL
jgi:hypothetical protein